MKMRAKGTTALVTQLLACSGVCGLVKASMQQTLWPTCSRNECGVLLCAGVCLFVPEPCSRVASTLHPLTPCQINKVEEGLPRSRLRHNTACQSTTHSLSGMGQCISVSRCLLFMVDGCWRHCDRNMLCGRVITLAAVYVPSPSVTRQHSSATAEQLLLTIALQVPPAAALPPADCSLTCKQQHITLQHSCSQAWHNNLSMCEQHLSTLPCLQGAAERCVVALGICFCAAQVQHSMPEPAA
jgi:hypothetical protein